MNAPRAEHRTGQDPPGRGLAIAAETLYLVNLLLLPGLAFLALLVLYLSRRHTAAPLAANHLSQTTGVSIIGGALIVTVLLAIVLLGALDTAWTWVVAILYFTFVHSTLILLGVLGLVRAMAGEHYRYPLLGRYFRS
ncbi:MAG: hypothetical protein R3F42_02260 [Pseudomonadota bacterium]